MRKNLLAPLFLISMIFAFNTSNAQTLIHYWNFNSFTTTYDYPQTFPIGPIHADYSTINTATAAVWFGTYPGTSTSWHNAGSQPIILDYGSADASDLNDQLGAPSGNYLRPRNPLDSAYIYYYIPTTGYRNIVLAYAAESSSTSSGDGEQWFDYSNDSGITWNNALLSVPWDSAAPTFTLFTISFTSDSAVNNNDGLVFRIHFVNHVTGTSGNNRFDNITVTGNPYYVFTTAASYGPFCNTSSNAISVAYTDSSSVTGTFAVQLSNAGGSFPSSFTSNIIGTGASSPISATIPPGTASGTYRVRVINAGDLQFGTDNGSNITINPIAGAITGTATVSVASTTPLSDTSTGGTWSSGATGVATVGSTGVVTGVSVGTANITYTNVYGCIATVTATVTAFSGSPITGTMTVCAGSTTALSDATTGGSWSSGATAIATVGSTGTVYGVSGGSAIITYSYSLGGSTTATVVVSPLPSAGTVTGPVSVCAGSTTTLSDATTGGAWSSTVTTVATVGSSGVVSGVSTGTTTISYTVTNGCGTAAATSIVTANPSPATITGTVTVCPGASAALTETTTGGTWSSGTTSIATVDGSGNVWGVTGGTAIISYSLSSGCYMTSVATINPLPTAGTITGTNTVSIGGMTTLSDAITGGTWSNTTTTIATVGTTGVVTGVSPGTSVISYSVSNVCGTTTATLTVTVINPNLTRGNLVVLQVGNGSAALSSSSQPIFAVEYTTSGTPTGVNIPLPTTTVSATPITTSGTQSEGNITLSAERDRIIVSGYEAIPGVASIAGTAATANPRELYTINSGGTASFAVSSTTAYTANNMRSGTASGTNYFGAGATAAVAGVVYMNTSTEIESLVKAYDVQIFNGQLYFACETTGDIGIVQVGTGVSTAAGQGATLLTPSGTLPTAYGFSISADGNTMYVADETNGIIKFTRTGGAGSFASAYTVNATPAEGLAVDYSGTNPVIYATTSALGSGNSIIKITDAGASSSSTTLVTAATNTGFRGLQFTPSCYASIAATSASTCSGNTDTLIITGNPTASVSYSNGASTFSATIGANGRDTIITGAITAPITYTLTSITTTACTSVSLSGSTTITVTSPPATITGTVNVCTASTTTLSDATTGGTWSSGNTAVATVISGTGVVTGVTGGTALITYTGTSGCNITATVNVSVPPPATSGASSVCTGSSTTLTDAVTGGTWSSNNGSLATVGSTSGTVYGVATGVPDITYTTLPGCTVVTPITVNTVPATPGSITGTASVCASGATTSLSDGTTGGAWSSTNTTIATAGSAGSVTGVSPGTTTISYTVTNSCGSAAATTIVTVNTLPAISATATPSALCVGNTLTLNATPSGGSGTYSTYLWSGPASFSAATQNATRAGITTGGAGIYSVTVTDNNGCTSAPGATATVTVNALPTITASATPTAICAGNTLTLNATPSGGSGTYSTYSWSGPGSFTAATQNTTRAGIATGGAGIYSVSVTDNNGCTSAAAGTTTSVTVNALPTITASVTPTAICVGNTLTLNATPSGGSGIYSTYSWSGPGSFTAAAQNTTRTGITTGGAGTYSVTVTDNNGCTSAMGTTTAVTVNVLPSITATVTPTALCAGNTLTLNATPSSGSGTYSTYSWSGPGSFTAATQNTTRASVTTGAAGIYTVTVTDNNGCTSAAGVTATVTVNALPSITANAAPTALCVGSTLTLNATPSGGSGTYSTYSWAGPGTFTATTQNTTRTGITTGGAGIYSVTVTDNNGCASATAGTTTAVTVNALPSITATATPTALCVGSTLTLNATPSGGSGTYSTYAWAGPASFTAATESTTRSGITTGGTGIYSVTVTDNNGCTSAPGVTATVTVNALPSVTASATPNPVCPGTTLTLNATPAGGSGTYSTYNWSGPGSFTATTQTAFNTGMTTSGAGVYSVSVTDNNGCTAASEGTTASVSLYTLPVITATATPTPLCAGSTLSLNATPASGSDTYTAFTWSGPGSFTASTQNAANSGIAAGGAGVYSVTVTDSHGCVSAMGTTSAVVVNALPNVSSFSLPSATAPCLGSASTVTVNSSSLGSGTFTVMYNLTGANTATGHTVSLTMGASTGTFTIPSTDLTSSGATTATVTSVMNSLGCNSTLSSGNSIVVTVNPLPSAITGTTSICYLSTATLSDSITGGAWSSSNTSVASVASSASGAVTGSSVGTATITYTLPTGCLTTTSVIINPIPNFYDVIGGGTFCSNDPTIHVGLNGSDPGASYQVYVGGFATGGLVTGTGGALDLGLQTTTGTYTVVANPSATCSATMTGSVNVTSTPAPNIYAVTGGGNYCSGGTGVPVGLSNSQSGISYQPYNGSTAIGGAVPGSTGSTISFGLETTAGTYTVIATNTSTSCNDTMTGSATVVIDSLPATISGAASVCTGVTTPLADGTSGGTWSSSSAAQATVGTSSGIVSGVAIGTTVITYTLPTTCIATKQLTVNLSPASIGGTPAVCLGLATALTDGTTGGAWSSGTISVASIGASSGILTSGIAGSTTITYTSLTGCTATVIATVNALPTVNNVTGGGSYCSGGTGVHVGLNGSVAGVNYQLYMGATTIGSPVAGTGSSLDFGAQTTAGTYTVIATNTTTGCNNNMSGSAVISINSLPAVFSMSTGGSYCTGGTGFDVMLGGSAAGISYQLYDGSTPIGSAVTGTGLSIDFGLQTLGGSYGVVATNPTTSCTSTMSGAAIVTIIPPPTAYSVSAAGGGSYCAGGTGPHIFLSSSAIGTNYQLFNSSNVPIGTTISGTGGSLDFGAVTAAGIYHVSATNTTTGCVGLMSGTATITINPLPVSTYSVTGGGAYCSGASSTSSVGLSNSTSTISYQLYVGSTAIGSPIVSTGGALNFGIESAAGTYTVIATNPLTGCVATMTGSAIIAVNSLPTVFAVTGGGSYCTGTLTVHVGLGASTVGVNYQLYNSGIIVPGAVLAGTGASLDFGALPAGSYTITATVGASGCALNMSGSAAIVVNPLPAAFTVSVTSGSYCVGNPAPHVLLGSSVVGTTYTLLYGATIVGSLAGTGSSLDFGPQTGTGTYTVTATNTVTGCTGPMTGTVTITTNSLPTPYPVTGGGSYCFAGTGRTVGLGGSTSGISYQLYVSGVAIGTAVTGAGAAFSFPLQTTVGAYTVVATNTGTGCVNNMTGSVSVSTTPLPTIYNVTGGGGYCAGATTGVPVGLSASDVGINYQLVKGGVTNVGTPLAGIGSAISFGADTAGTYTVIATNTTTNCVSTMYGNAVSVINPLPAVYSISSGGSYCAGGSGYPVALSNSAVGINYQLLDGGVSVGGPLAGTGALLNFGNQTAAGNYTIVATNATTLCNNNMSGTAIVSVNPLPTVYSVTSTGTSYCAGGTGVQIGLSASASGTTYQLYNAGAIVPGANLTGSGAMLNFGLQLAGVYTVVASNPTTSCTNAMSGTITVTTNPLPLLYTVTGGGGYCFGGSGVPVNLSGSTAGINYQLMTGGSPAGAPLAGAGSALSFGLQTTGGTYTVIASNVTTGCTNTMTGSAIVSVNALPALQTVMGGGDYCPGGTGVDVSIGGSATGISYQLYDGAVAAGPAMPGTGTSIDFGLQTAPGTYTVVATNTGTTCSGAMSGSATIAYYPLPAVYSVTGGGNYCPGSTGVAVGLSGSSTGVNYQLYNGILPVSGTFAGTGLPIDFGLQTTTGAYTVVATNSTTSCTNNMSGSVSVGVSALPAAFTITGGGNYCAGGAGQDISLLGSAVGNTYQLFNGIAATGAPLAGTGYALDFGLETAGGTYTIVATSTATSCANLMIGSVAIIVNSLPAAYSLTGGGNYCAGAGGVPVGLFSSQPGTSYQLFNGTTAEGLPVTGTGSAISFGLQTVAGTYTVVATGSGAACTGNMPGSATVVVNPLPTAYALTGGGNYCPGGDGVHVGLSNSDAGITYLLYNGTSVVSSVAGTGFSLDFGLQTATGTYSVAATNMATGCTGPMSGTVTIAVNPAPAVYSVSSSASQYCAGGEGVSLTLSNSNTGINYQLYVGSVPAGSPIVGSGLELDFGLQTAAGIYTVIATNATTSCVSNMASSATIIIDPLPAPYSVTGGGNYCPGGPGVHVGVASSQTGFSYQLYNGGFAVGGPVFGTGLSIDFGLQTATGTYTVMATNPVTACVNNMAGSVTVGLNTLPAAYAVTGGGNYCSGAAGVSIGLGGSATGVTYQLYNGISAIGSSRVGLGLAIDFGPQTSAGTYTVIATSASTGCTNVMTGAATVGINSLPSAYSVTGGGNYCVGGPGVHVGLFNSVTGVNYQLYNGTLAVGIPVPGTASALDFGLQTTAGAYTIVATNSTTGCTNNMSGTATVVVDALPAAYSVIGGGNYCEGGTGVSIGLGGSNSGISYQLFNGLTPAGGAISGAGGPINFGLQTDTGAYTVVASNPATGCTASMMGGATVTLGPLVTPSLTLSASGGDTICSGTLVTFIAAVVNGGTTPAYAWTVNGAPVVSAGSTYTYAPAVGDVVGLTLTSSAVCATPAMVSASLPLTVQPRGMPAVTISSDLNPVCQGTPVTFTPAITFGGAAPAYSWLVNGIAQSAAPVFNYIPADHDVVSAFLTSDYHCRLATSVASNDVIMEVDASVTPAVVVTANPGTYVQQGEAVTFSATITNSVAAPSYQWVLNGAPIPGATQSVYTTSSFANLDSFSCVVVSGGGCAGMSGAGGVTIHTTGEGVNQVTATASDIQLVPNPNKGIFTIKGTLGTPDDQTVTIEITDMLGQVIYKKNVMAHDGVLDQKIQLNSVANGMYLLNLHSASANNVFHMVIEQ